MNRALGLAGISLGFGACVLGLVSVVLGIRRHEPKLIRQGALYAVLTLVGAVIAFAAMERALITRDFSLAYVQHVGSTKTPRLFNVASLWSSLEGSILLWVFIQTGYVVLVVRHFRARLADPLVGWAMATLFVITGFFFLLTMGPANPFRSAATVAFEGQGPNPLLQDHVLMAFHPPILYLGFVGFSVPFSFAIAALITGRVGEGWLVERAAGRCSRGVSSPSASCSARGGATRCSAGVATGRGTPSRTRASSRGSRAPRSSTR